jgi:hypothetical protein
VKKSKLQLRLRLELLYVIVKKKSNIHFFSYSNPFLKKNGFSVSVTQKKTFCDYRSKLNINTNKQIMLNFNNPMSNSNVVPLANWGKNSFSSVSHDFIVDQPDEYVCYTLPRTMFRAAASLFSDIRHTDQQAKFDEITLQVFLQMISMSSNLEKAPEVFP